MTQSSQIPEKGNTTNESTTETPNKVVKSSNKKEVLNGSLNVSERLSSEEDFPDDTTVIEDYGTTMKVTGANQQIILFVDKTVPNTKVWYENTFMTSLVYPIFTPIIVAAVTVLIMNRINKKTEDAQLLKLEGEVDKLNVETNNLRKSFKPLVLSTIQSVQNKILGDKIDGLRVLNTISKTFQSQEQHFEQGEPVVADYHTYIKNVYTSYSVLRHADFEQFYNKYAILFPKAVYESLQTLKTDLTTLKNGVQSYHSMQDQDLEPTDDDIKLVEQLIKRFEDCLLQIRKDCHLDTNYVHDFVAENK
jgi:hypothetical protein